MGDAVNTSITRTLVSKQAKFRHFMFTLYTNWDVEDDVYREEVDVLEKVKCRYICYGKEKGDLKGGCHLQCMVSFHDQKTLSAARKLVPKRSSNFQAIRLLDAAIVYCQKDGDFVQRGDRPVVGKGASAIERYDDAMLAAKEGRLEDVPSDLMLKHRPNLLSIAAASQVAGDVIEMDHLWIHGKPGKGKSKGPRQIYGSRLFLKKAANKWFDGWDSAIHDVLLIDDMGTEHYHQMSNLKNWSDVYWFPCEVKHGSLFIRPTRIIVTSNHTIEEIFSKHYPQVDIDALNRRFDKLNCDTKERVARLPFNAADDALEWIKSEVAQTRLALSSLVAVVPEEPAEPVVEDVTVVATSDEGMLDHSELGNDLSYFQWNDGQDPSLILTDKGIGLKRKRELLLANISDV